MLGRNEYKALLTVYLAIAASIALPAVLLELMLISANVLLVFKVSVLVLFLANVSITINWQRVPYYHPYALFLGAFGFFFILPIAFDVLQLQSLGSVPQFSDVTLSESTQMRMMLSVYLAMIGVQAGAILGQKKTLNYFNMTTNTSWSKVGLFFFYLGLPFLLYQNVMTGLGIQEQGYAAKVLGQIDIQSSLLTLIMATLSYAGFLVYLASFHRSSWFYVHFTLFVLVLALQIVMLECKVFVSMVFVLTFFLFLYNRRLRERFFILPLVFVIGVSVIFRLSVLSESRPYSELLLEQVKEQGESIESLGFTIDSIRQIPFTFRHIADGVKWHYAKEIASFTNDTIVYAPMSVLGKYELFDYRLSQLMDEDAMQQGHLVKSTYLSELYAIFGAVAVFIGHFLLGLFLVLGVDRLLRFRIGVLILLLVLPSVVFVPTRILSFVESMAIAGAMFFIMILANFYRKINKRGRNEEV